MHQEISYDYDAPDCTTVDMRRVVLAAHWRAQQERDSWRELSDEIDRRLIAYRAIGVFSWPLYATANGKPIDDRECAPFDDADADWGEQDDLRNVPRKAARCD